MAVPNSPPSIPNDYSCYSPIDCDKREIRLVRPEWEGSRYKCTMGHFSLADCPPYTAISYRWGSLRDTVPLHVKHPTADAVGFQVCRSVDQAITAIRTEKTTYLARSNTLPETKKSELDIDWLWIDMLCINQGDNRERSLHVRYMDKIYAKAARVLVWLGGDPLGKEGSLLKDGDELISRAFGLICERARWVHSIALHRRSLQRERYLKVFTRPDGQLDTTFLEAVSNPRQGLDAQDEELEQFRVILWITCLSPFQGSELKKAETVEKHWDVVSSFLMRSSHLFGLEWFRRIWVLQEVMNGGDRVQVRHGNVTLPWRVMLDMDSAANWIERSITGSEDPAFSKLRRRLSKQLPRTGLAEAWQHLHLAEDSVDNLFAVTSTFLATDPRDKIFAVYRLCAEGQSLQSYEPSDSDSIGETSAKLARAVMLHRGDSGFLDLVLVHNHRLPVIREPTEVDLDVGSLQRLDRSPVGYGDTPNFMSLPDALRSAFLNLRSRILDCPRLDRLSVGYGHTPNVNSILDTMSSELELLDMSVTILEDSQSTFFDLQKDRPSWVPDLGKEVRGFTRSLSPPAFSAALPMQLLEEGCLGRPNASLSIIGIPLTTVAVTADYHGIFRKRDSDNMVAIMGSSRLVLPFNWLYVRLRTMWRALARAAPGAYRSVTNSNWGRPVSTGGNMAYSSETNTHWRRPVSTGAIMAHGFDPNRFLNIIIRSSEDKPCIGDSETSPVAMAIYESWGVELHRLRKPTNQGRMGFGVDEREFNDVETADSEFSASLESCCSGECQAPSSQGSAANTIWLPATDLGNRTDEILCSCSRDRELDPDNGLDIDKQQTWISQQFSKYSRETGCSDVQQRLTQTHPPRQRPRISTATGLTWAEERLIRRYATTCSVDEREQMKETLSDSLMNTEVFATGDQRFGICRLAVEPGDLVVYLSGSRGPCILRPTRRPGARLSAAEWKEEPTYRYMGPCTLEGFDDPAVLEEMLKKDPFGTEPLHLDSGRWNAAIWESKYAKRVFTLV